MHKKCKMRGVGMIDDGVRCKQASEEQGYQETLATWMKLLQDQRDESSSLWRSMKLLRGNQSLVDDI